MNQLSAPFAEKLDASLAELCNERGGVSPSTRYPVLVRCHRHAIAEVARQVEALGGQVRHHLTLVGAIAAWLPLSQIERLARDSHVSRMELEQSFTTA